MRKIARPRLVNAVHRVILLGERDLDFGIALERSDNRIGQRFGIPRLVRRGRGSRIGWRIGIRIGGGNRCGCGIVDTRIGFRRIAAACSGIGRALHRI